MITIATDDFYIIFFSPVVMFLINVFSVKVAARFLDFASSFKLLVCATIVVMGLWKAAKNGKMNCNWPPQPACV